MSGDLMSSGCLTQLSEESRQRDNLFNKRLFDERQRLLAKVLHSMAKTLNFKIEQLEIFEGGYTPQGWQDEFVDARGTQFHSGSLPGDRRRFLWRSFQFREQLTRSYVQAHLPLAFLAPSSF